MPASPLKALVVGVGPHGRRVVQVLAKRTDVQLTALVDRSAEALAAANAPASAVHFADYAQALATGVDVVAVCTNGPSHSQLAHAALDAGVRRLMISKPLACSLEECAGVLEHAAKVGARVAVDHIRRHHPTYRYLRDQIQSGAWGQPRSAYMQRPGIGLGCNGTHSYDALRFVLGREVEAVLGFVDAPKGPNPRGSDFIDPGGLTVMHFGGELRAVVAQVEDGAGPSSLEIDLTGARVRYDERTGALEIVEKDLSVKPGPGKPASFKNAEVPPGVAATVDMHQGLGALFDELNGDGPMLCDGQQGLESIRVLVATYLSSREGHRLVRRDDAALRALWLPVT